MSFAKRLLLFFLVLTLAGIIVILLAPLLVSDGLRLFAWMKGREQGIKIEFQKIDAPFLKPVVIHGLRVTSARPCLFRVDLAAERATFDLNLRTVFFLSNARVLHAVSIEGLRCEIRRDPHQTAECHFDWRFLHRLLADQVELTNVDLRVNNGSTDFGMRGVEWSASEIESGKFTAREVDISTPLFRQRFTDLRGATKWENDHLTLGALSLARGLDVETITADFSRFEQKRIGIELNLDAFGGKVRASIASENRDKGIVWNVAGNASAISLAQMSTALGLREPAGGSVRACKFTFHGDVQNLTHATASVWTEVSGFIWRDRLAETVMFGASLYNRQVEVEQLYVKQRNNQFTLSGEYALPAKSADWINPNFRADISTSINDLGEFAKLFGGSAESFSGSLNISGTVNGREQNLGGQITVEGNSLRLWAAPIDSLHAKLNLKGAQLSLESLQARHLDDFFNATGEINLARDHRYAVKLNAGVSSLAGYLSLLPERTRDLKPEGRASIGWDGHGTVHAHSGDFRILAENVCLTSDLGLRPFDVKLDGTYSPQNIFFREFRLSNPQTEFNSFVSVASNYLQLQTVRFDLNGKSKLQGNVFIPVALSRWWRTRSLDEFNENQNFDVDLMLDELDLGELQRAVSEHTSISGKLSGRLETYGSLASLQSKFQAHLRDFIFGDPQRLSADIGAEVVSNSLRLHLRATTTDPSPMQFEATLPLQLKPPNQQHRSIFAWDQPFAAKTSFSVLLPKVPRYITRQIFHDGILTGSVTGAGTLQRPILAGELSLLNGRFVKSPGPITGLSGSLQFHDTFATIAFANVELQDVKLGFGGAIDFADISNLSIKLVPELPVFDLTSAAPDQCISGANIFALRRVDADTNASTEVQEIELHGALDSRAWTITLSEHGRAQPLNSKSLFARTFSFCPSGGEVLQLAVPATKQDELGQRALNIFRGREQPSPTLKPPQPH